MYVSGAGVRTKLAVYAVLVALLSVLFVSGAAAQSTHSATLNWTLSTDSGSTYNAYRISGACPSSATTGQGTKLTSTPLASGTTTFTDAGLAVGSYCYYVTAVLNGAESVPSNLAPAVVLPQAPSALTVTVK